MNILIPNAPGPKNLGDLAIFEVLVSKLENVGHKILVHKFNPELEENIIVRPDIYYWIAFQDRNFFVRVARVLLLSAVLFLPSGLESMLPRELRAILSDYKGVDKVILKGGGYFRSRPGLTQQINVVMNCVYILFAKKYEKEVTIRPMSFGPFSNKLTEWICAKCVNLADKIYVRDRISFKLLQKYISKQKLYEEPDEAFLEKPVKVTKYEDITLGFTVREWVGKSKRKAFLINMADLIEQIAQDKNCSWIQPIIQVDAPEYSEGDEKITKQLSKILVKRGLKVREPLKPNSVVAALTAFGKLSYLVGMRMHSCIFAHIQKVPFTAVAYEHKHSSLEKFADAVISVKNLQRRLKKDKKVAFSKKAVYNTENL